MRADRFWSGGEVAIQLRWRNLILLFFADSGIYGTICTKPTLNKSGWMAIGVGMEISDHSSYASIPANIAPCKVPSYLSLPGKTILQDRSNYQKFVKAKSQSCSLPVQVRRK